MSKRMTDLNSKIDKNKLYSLEEAIALVKETSNVKFDATVELHARMGVDPKKTDQQVRANVVLPHGTGKTKTIAAFVGPNDEETAKSAGADFIMGEEEIKKIKTSGKAEFDVAVATPEMMPKIAVAARVLGPRGLMPNPKTGTVDKDVTKMIEELKKGKVSFKTDNTANIHQAVGKISFSETQLKENIETFLEALQKARPQTAKGTYIKVLFLCSSMGPSVKIEIV